MDTLRCNGDILEGDTQVLGEMPNRHGVFKTKQLKLGMTFLGQPCLLNSTITVNVIKETTGAYYITDMEWTEA